MENKKFSYHTSAPKGLPDKNIKPLLRKPLMAYDSCCFGYIMPQERSVDIDGPLDMRIAETLLQVRENLEGPEELR